MFRTTVQIFIKEKTSRLKPFAFVIYVCTKELQMPFCI